MLPFQNVFEIRNNVSTPLPISVKLFLKSLPITILDLPNSGWCDLAKFCNLANFWMGGNLHCFKYPDNEQTWSH